MTTYEIVSDDRRRPRRGGGRGPGPVALALLDGKTVLITTTYRGGGSLRNTLRKRGFRLITRMEPGGLLVWAERIEP